jgi:DNA-binding winged helix-turn-helix (wHTH) protein
MSSCNEAIEELRLGGTVFRFAGFEMDQRDELRGPDGVVVKLRPQTSEMLRLFAANAGRVISKQELMEAIWPTIHVGEDSLFQCIRDIRGALGDHRRQVIKLAAGGGYVLTAEVSVVPPELAAVPDVVSPRLPADPDSGTPAEMAPLPPPWSQSIFGSHKRVTVAVILGTVVALAGVTKLAWLDRIVQPAMPVIAMVPIGDASNDPRGAMMAAEITSRLADGFAKIDNIKLIVSPAARAESSAAPIADFELRGELQRGEQSWTLRSRIVRTATGEMRSVATVSVEAGEADVALQQSRLAAGAGHLLASRLNELLEAQAPPDAGGGASTGDTKVVIEQAIASINQTTPERFGMAQTILKKALADQPGSVNLAVALASLQLRGIQMVWYSPDDMIATEAEANATLERALRATPDSIPVLEARCRFLSATNHFLESLVVCARLLSRDPWSGAALYLIGLGQINLGRFEDALATFQQADRFDTPSVSRWTWLLGAGWANLLMGRGEDALPWLRRSIAITAASGRSYMLLAAAYQKVGRLDDAKAALQDGLKLRPNTTSLNVAPPMKNSSPVFIEASNRVIQLMVDAGLSEH